MAEENLLFNGCVIHIISKCIGPKRYQFFKNQIVKNGGTIWVGNPCESSLSHVIYDEGLLPDDPDIKRFISLQETRNIVGTKWLSECIKNNKLVPVDKFKLIHSETKHQEISVEENSKVNEPEPFMKNSNKDIEITSKGKMTKEQETITEKSLNTVLIAELSKLGKSYKSLGDVYRSRNYFSVISIIQKYPKQITSYEEALVIGGISQRMALKIGEILETGSLRKTNELTDNDKVRVINLFTQIWGVGPATADNWYRRGYRTIDDVKSKCNLNRMQQVGVKYFDDFQKHIPRYEVEEISTIVKEKALSVDPTVKVEICGSYRRGKTLCGDIDIVIFEEKEDHSQLMEKLLAKLTASGLVSNEFVSLEVAKHHKFLGICKLPGKNTVFRRLDIFIAPHEEYAPAMIHYTGSANFNISLRQHAIKTGKHLSENGLFDNVVRQGNTVVSSNVLHTPTEQSVFQILGVPFRIPEERETLIT